MPMFVNLCLCGHAGYNREHTTYIYISLTYDIYFDRETVTIETF